MYLNYKSLPKFLILLILIPIGFFGFVLWSGNMETSSGKASDSEFRKPLLMPFQTSSIVKSVYTLEKK
jgi:hypothetical protein